MDMSGIWDQVQDIGGDADAADWRTGLDEDARQRIVNKMYLCFALIFEFHFCTAYCY